MEVTIPPEWMNRTIGEINIRKKYNINILALKKRRKARYEHYAGYAAVPG